jgi:hypothetical protein
MIPLRGHGVYAEPGSNDHIRLYDFDAAGKKRSWRVLSLFETLTSRSRSNESEKTVMTLRINEMYLNKAVEPGKPLDFWDCYRVQKIDKVSGTVTFRHHAATSLDDNASRLFTVPNTTKGIKIRVNPIGEIDF